jgi:MoaA/NifB/PqqE/SkfB family radical SAM enzyme
VFEKYLRHIHKVFSFCYGNIARILYPYVVLPPSKLHILVTSNCNLRCCFCYAKDGLNHDHKNLLTLSEWEQLSKKISRLTAVIFTGGEPFVHKDIYNILSIMLQKKLMISVTTNGTNIDAEKLMQLPINSLFVLMFSLHGPKEIHDKVTGKSKSFDIVIKTINKIAILKKKLNLKYPILSIKCVITEENANYLWDLVTFINKELPVAHVYFNLKAENSLHHALNLYKNINNKQLNRRYIYHYKNKEKVINFLKHLEQNRHQLKIDVGFTDSFNSNTDLYKYIKQPEDFVVKPCNRPFHEMLIYSNGDYGNCLGLVSGNLREYAFSIKDALGSSHYRNFIIDFKQHRRCYEACYACKEGSFVNQSDV